MTKQQTTDKPIYRVPSMAEIAALPWNGLNCVSTFSGCGGSSLGYKMAGFKVLWANEFIPAAQETYRANHPNTILDTRDIRTVTTESILDAIRMQPGELDLFDGSPPCASFSTAGKREAGWGKVKQYSDTKQRTDDLFFEYARLVRGIQPKVFIAENVSGLVKGTAKGYFKEILQALKDCGYNVKAQLLDAQWLGVPQMRQRIIFMGVRNDLNTEPRFPTPLPYRYSVRDALPWIVQQGDNGGFGGGPHLPATEPSPTIGTGPQTGNGRYPPSAVIANSVDAHWIVDNEAKNWEIVTAGNERHALAGRRPTHTVAASPAATVMATESDFNLLSKDKIEKRKFTIAELRRICAFPDDFILTGTYAQQWERLGRAVPPVMMSHIAHAAQEVLEQCSIT